MKYILLIYRDEKKWATMPQEDLKRTMGAYMAYTEALKASGALLAGDRLQPVGTAASVRGTSGTTQVVDGPYAETKEQLGGYYLIEAPDQDAALEWAKRCPGVEGGVVEVRAVMHVPPPQ